MEPLGWMMAKDLGSGTWAVEIIESWVKVQVTIRAFFPLVKALHPASLNLKHPPMT